MKNLLIVESPAKAKTIEKYLGKSFKVRASMGHLRDLPKSRMAVDVDNNFTPEYVNIRGKAALIKELKLLADTAENVYLATDPDREGEAIAWQLAELLTVDQQTACRVEFNEITKHAVAAAVANPRPIDDKRVEAQQARRILDRLVGYRLSPLLWKKVKRGLSAGRVQSVAVRLICDREEEIESFVVTEYWSIQAQLIAADGDMFLADLATYKNEKLEINDGERAAAVVDDLKEQNFKVSEVKKSLRKRNPLPPFITSTLQQDASRQLGYSGKKTMMLAQQLYEGLSVGAAGQVGLITYMRTDSTRIAGSFQDEARQYISANYGKDYIPAKPFQYVKKQAQDAHEAIRPTSTEMSPQVVQQYLTNDQFKLYRLIWQRFLASQMSAAQYDTVSAKINAGDYGLRSSGSKLKFSGFLAVYADKEEKDKYIPDLAEGQMLACNDVISKQHFTEPPPRFNEASLIKLLEEKGIGRPSTYATIISTIQDRGYVAREDKRFFPTMLGRTVNDLLKGNFAEIVDVDFTAALEERLDLIAEGNETRLNVLQSFYGGFNEEIENAENNLPRVQLPVQETDEICEKCGKNMVIKSGRFGDFLACPGWPDCKNAKPITVKIDAVCPLCGGGVVERKSKKGKKFYGCANYPNCNFISWGIPIADSKCEHCGSYLVKGSFRGRGTVISCGNEECSSKKAADGTKKKTASKKKKVVKKITRSTKKATTKVRK